MIVACVLIIITFNRSQTKLELVQIIHGRMEWRHNTTKLRSSSKFNTDLKYVRTQWIKRVAIPDTDIIYSCDWSHSDDKPCSELVQNIKKKMNSRRILFLGDSTMGRLFNKIPRRGKNIITTNRCNWLQNFGIKKSTTWISPPKDAGPVKYGLENNWCTDCSGCKSRFSTGEGIANSYIAVEFAKDVEMQSEIGSTSQETLVNFLKTHHKYELCVVNSGIHDQAIKYLTTQHYVANVKHYLQLLSLVCPQTVWIETTFPKTDNYLQTKTKTQEWNVAVNDMINLDFTGVYIIKVGNASIHWPHADNVHLDDEWYSSLSRLFKE